MSQLFRPVLQGLRSISETDFTKKTPLLALVLLFFALRAPFLNHGHGTDPDAWRVALTAHHLLETGDYFPSRLPGNPLHELVITPFITGGWLATNLLTASVSLVAVYLFALVLKWHEFPDRGTLTIGFAFTPLLFINSISTMDYMWALTAILGAYYASLRGWPIGAGILVGLAVGFRLPSLIVLLPLSLVLWHQERLAAVLPFILAALGTSALAFSPVLATYGLDFYNFFDQSVSYEALLRLLGKEAIGVLGSFSVLLALALSFKRLAQLPSDLKSDPIILAWLVTLALYLATFSRLPHEIAYLVPAFPFAFLLMARYFTRAALSIAVTSILFAGVVDVTSPGDSLSLSALREASIGRGLILSNAQTMEQQKDFVEQIIEDDLPEHSVVLTGFIFPQLAVRERDQLESRILDRDYGAVSMLSDRGEAVDSASDVRFVWLLKYETFDALRSQGYAFFMVPDAADSTLFLYDYRPALFGTAFLDLSQDRPSAASGSGSRER